MTADKPLVLAITGDLRALGAYLRHLRELDGSNLMEIARQAAIDPHRLAALEAGDADPTIRELATLAHVLDVVLHVGFRPVTVVDDPAAIPTGMTEDEEDAFWGTHVLSKEAWDHLQPVPPHLLDLLEGERQRRTRLTKPQPS